MYFFLWVKFQALLYTEGIGCAAPGCEHNSTDELMGKTVPLVGFRLYELNKHKFVFDCFI